MRLFFAETTILRLFVAVFQQHNTLLPKKQLRCCLEHRIQILVREIREVYISLMLNENVVGGRDIGNSFAVALKRLGFHSILLKILNPD